MLGLLAGWLWAGGVSWGDELVYPLDIVSAADGQVLIADRKLPGVLRLLDGHLTTLVTGSKRFREPLNAVWCVALDREGRVLVGDSAARGIFRLRSEGPPEKINTDYIGIPIRMAVDRQGRIYVSDLETQRIWRLPPEGGKSEEFAVVAGVRGLAFDQQDRLWTVRANPPQLVRYTAAGEPETIVNEGPFEFPQQLAVDAEGETAYVADGYAQAIWRVRSGQAAEKWVHGPPLVNPTGILLQEAGLLVVDPRVPGLFRVSLEGEVSPFYVPKAGAPAAGQVR